MVGRDFAFESWQRPPNESARHPRTTCERDGRGAHNAASESHRPLAKCASLLNRAVAVGIRRALPPAASAAVCAPPAMTAATPAHRRPFRQRGPGGGPRRGGWASLVVVDSAKPTLSVTAQHEASRIN